MDDSGAVTEDNLEISDQFARLMNAMPRAPEDDIVPETDSDVSDMSEPDEQDGQEPVTLLSSLMGIDVSINSLRGIN